MKPSKASFEFRRPLLAMLLGFTFTSVALATPSTTIVISQVYGGGGNSGAPYNRDFVELHNISGSSVDVTGWSVQYASSSGTSWSSTVLAGSIPAGGYYLVGLASGANGSALPAPDASGGSNLSSTAGKVALSNASAALSGSDPSAGATVVDFVGFGTANAFETAAAPAPSNTTSIARLNNGSTDTDNNSSDFVAGAPAPRNKDSTPFQPSDATPPTLISLSPANNATGVPVGTTLSLVFNEAVAKLSGNITVKLTSDDSSIYVVDVTTAAVSVSGSTVTITLPGSLAPSTGFHVNVDATAFEDLAGNDFAGISGSSTWTFTTAAIDSTPPAVSTLSPADDSTSVHPAVDLVIAYDEPILAGSGDIVIKKSSDDTIVETLAVPGPRVSVSGLTIIIDATSPLDFGTDYHVEVAAGTVTDAALNGNPAISGNTAWNFTTRTAPAVLISQTYEGLAAADRYVELKNLTGSSVDLTGYRLTVWSDTPPSDNEGWKAGNLTTDRDVALDGLVIPAQGYLLVANSGASIPGYAAVSADAKSSATDPATFFDGDDSVVLYDGASNALANIADAVSISANSGANTSFHRLNDAIGFDFKAGSSLAAYPASWATRSLADVNTATIADEWYLKASQPPKFLSLTFNVATFSEAAGAGAATATVTRSGPTTESAFVNITSSDETEVTVTSPIEIAAGSSSAMFPLDAVDDPLPDGSKVVTITVQSDGLVSASAPVTVTDDGLDPAITAVINEVDVDQTGADVNEFIELYNTSATPQSLDGLVLVLFNGDGTNDPSYSVIDLTGFTIPGHDYFVVGSSTVPNVDYAYFTSNGIQNGPDAIALCVGTTAEFPTGTPAAAVSGLVDALVYDTADADDIALIAALTPGKPQIDENGGGNGETSSMSRVPDGGAAFDTTLFIVQSPTPGVTNGTGANDYDTWATATGAVQGPTGDDDMDGLDNDHERAFGLNPTSAASVNPFTAPFNKTTGKFTYTRRTQPLTGLTYKVFTSTTTLSDAGWTHDTGATVSVSGPVADVETVEVTLSAPAPLTAPRLFIKVVAE